MARDTSKTWRIVVVAPYPFWARRIQDACLGAAIAWCVLSDLDKVATHSSAPQADLVIVAVGAEEPGLRPALARLQDIAKVPLVVWSVWGPTAESLVPPGAWAVDGAHPKALSQDHPMYALVGGQSPPQRAEDVLAPFELGAGRGRDLPPSARSHKGKAAQHSMRILMLILAVELAHFWAHVN